MVQDRRSEKPEGVQWITIGRERSGQRIDNFLFAQFKGVPRARIYRMLRKGEVRVNGSRCRPGTRIREGDRVRLPPVSVRSAAATQAPVPKQLRDKIASAFLFEDSEMGVLDKPSGIAVHGGSGTPCGAIEVLRALRPQVEWGLAHRLDRGTSGCLAVGKGARATRALQAAFRQGQVEKGYLTLLAGEWTQWKAEVTAPLRREWDGGSNWTMIVDPESGWKAETRFFVLRILPSFTLVQAEPKSGRTHQIRVHAHYLGHPLAGDPVYGDGAANGEAASFGLKRIFLHGAELRLPHPVSGNPLTFRAPLPPELQGVLDRLIELDKASSAPLDQEHT